MPRGGVEWGGGGWGEGWGGAPTIETSRGQNVIGEITEILERGGEGHSQEGVSHEVMVFLPPFSRETSPVLPVVVERVDEPA